MINARAESVATSRAYAQSFERRRCLVPADGWYEWLKLPGLTAGGKGGRAAKQPYFMTRRDGDPIAFAGVWSVWGDGDNRLMTCSVITVAAAGELALVHDRMPLALPSERWAGWLGEGGGTVDPTTLLNVPSEDFLAGIELRPVGAAVGDVRNDGPDLIRAVPAPPLVESSVEAEDATLF
jgi:putative SOS response-associated peptidase YedK